MLPDEVIDKIRSTDEEGYVIVTSRILKYNHNVKQILLLCTASLKALNNKVHPIVLGENTSFSIMNRKSPLLFAEIEVGRGELILGVLALSGIISSIERCDDLKFALNLLSLPDIEHKNFNRIISEVFNS